MAIFLVMDLIAKMQSVIVISLFVTVFFFSYFKGICCKTILAKSNFNFGQ